jgi:TPR repeat protein
MEILKGYIMTDPLSDGMNAYANQDYAKAYEILYPLGAYSRNDEAQFYLGMMFFYGEGVEQSTEVAMNWWKKAMRGGNVDAAYRLSEIATSTKTTF